MRSIPGKYAEFVLNAPSGWSLPIAHKIAVAVVSLCTLLFVYGIVISAQIGSEHPNLYISGEWTAAGLRTAAAQLGVSPAWVTGYHLSIEVILGFVSFGVAWLLLRTQPQTWFKIYLAVVLTLTGIAGGNVMVGLLHLSPVFTGASNWVFPIVWIAFFQLLYIFPDGHFVPGWSRWLPVVWGIGLFALAGFQQSVQVTLLWGLVFLAMIATGIFGQIQRFRRGDPVQKEQIRWTTTAFALRFVLVFCVIATPVGPFINQPTTQGLIGDLIWTPISYLASAIFVIAIGIAILRYRLFDIELILNRALVYGALTTFVIGVYALIVEGIGALLQVEGNTFLSLLATGLVAIAFNPLRAWLQRAVNRLLYGQRSEPYAVAAHLGRQMETAFAPGDLLHAIAQTIGQTLKLPQVEIVLIGDDQVTMWQGNPVKTSAYHAYPLTYQGEHLGDLRVTPRTGEALGGADRQLLEDLARQAAIAVHAAQVTLELQRSRERIVTAREEERRRIRRDLHDGLGPQLAAQSLKLETAHDLILTQPARAQAVLDDLLTLSQKMVGEIRQLVYALRPPALDDFGLLGAIQEIVGRVVPPTLSVELRAPEQLPPLPAAVEVAAYRIAQEAITNVVKHGQATQALVQIDLVARRRENDTLLLEIRDNGRGIAADMCPGVGLHSMRERAVELDGVLSITSNQPQGTVVHAELPVSRLTE